jgi:hypothetical protein
MSVSVERLVKAAAEQDSRPGDGAVTYIFEKGEEVPADHPAVLAFPHLFDFTRCAAGEADAERDG